MEWFESNTTSRCPGRPIRSMGVSPDTIHIHSTVENPELIAGREVEFNGARLWNEDAPSSEWFGS